LRQSGTKLVRRCPGFYVGQTCQWAETAWRFIAKPRGRELRCLTLHSDGRLVAVWPMAIERAGSLHIVRPLGTEGSEYSGPLVEDGPALQERTRRLWKEAMKLGDLVILPNVRADAPLAGVLNEAGLLRAPDTAAPAPYIARRDYADWAAYKKTLSSSLRHKLRRVRRRLAEQGAVSLAIEDPSDAAPLLDWMLEQKRRWLEHHGLTSEWIGRDDYRDFLVGLASQPDTGVKLFALKIDGVPIAGQLATVDPMRFQAHIGVYDPQWSFYAPGQVLTEHCMARAFVRGLDFDLRVGDEAYKRDWAPRSCDATTLPPPPGGV
jgi:CelD/BcsL family acetyltransferase involved in cellulose biosynthesis